MFLEVIFTNGTTLEISLTDNHTVNVIGPANTIENSFSLGGVKDIQFHTGTLPVTTPAPVDPEPAPVAPIGISPDPTIVTTPIEAAAPAAPESAPDPSPADPPAEPPAEPEPQPTTDDGTPIPTPDTGTATNGVSEVTLTDPFPGVEVPVTVDPPQATTSTGGDDTSTTTTVEDPAHADAVASAGSSIAVASDMDPYAAGVVARTALADVEAALVTWPDSAPLLDAKAQLEQIAGTAA